MDKLDFSKGPVLSQKANHALGEKYLAEVNQIIRSEMIKKLDNDCRGKDDRCAVEGSDWLISHALERCDEAEQLTIMFITCMVSSSKSPGTVSHSK